MVSSAVELVQDAQSRGWIFSVTVPYGILIIIISIVNLIIGSVFLGQCTIQPNIPIYLIVQGITMLILYSLLFGTVNINLFDNIIFIFI
jgi:hypothetical protein